jgi:hypothetical protein
MGCAGVGPHTVARDRFDYTTAISDSWKSQMLVNMVKMRYGDAPTFLDVASVINQYSVESQVDLRLSWADPVTSALTNTQTAGGAARYIDRPTITYSPLSGERFARSLMTPIPPASILSLIQANYPVDLVLRLCVHSVNGIRNRFGGGGTGPSRGSRVLPAARKAEAASGFGGNQPARSEDKREGRHPHDHSWEDG